MASSRRSRRSPSRLGATGLLAVVLLLLSGAAAPTTAAPGSGGNVMPATAQPHGWSLDRMTAALALFSSSGNAPEFFPDTPFQILYADPTTQGADVLNRTLLATGTNEVQVRPGTKFFVPLWNATDSPPVVGQFPETSAEAADYFFDAAQLGGRNFTISVDGRTTPLGRANVSGVVRSPVPLEDGGGSHIVTVGVFLTPLTPGTHEVVIRAELHGPPVAALLAGLGADVFAEEFTYTVHVVAGRGHRRL